MSLFGAVKRFFNNVDKYQSKVDEHGLPEPKETPPIPKVKAPKKPRAKKPKVIQEVTDDSINKNQNAKALATAAKQPWVNVLGIELDLDDISSGNFELDWNDIFVQQLRDLGYEGRTDADVVDQWFRQLCLGIVHETFEQEMADPDKRAQYNRKNLGNGRIEVS